MEASIKPESRFFIKEDENQERICHGGSKLTPVKVCIAATARMGNREGANISLHRGLANRWI